MEVVRHILNFQLFLHTLHRCIEHGREHAEKLGLHFYTNPHRGPLYYGLATPNDYAVTVELHVDREPHMTVRLVETKTDQRATWTWEQDLTAAPRLNVAPGLRQNVFVGTILQDEITTPIQHFSRLLDLVSEASRTEE